MEDRKNDPSVVKDMLLKVEIVCNVMQRGYNITHLFVIKV